MTDTKARMVLLPEGWMAVPSTGMTSAMRRAFHESKESSQSLDDHYRAAIAAAPALPEQPAVSQERYILDMRAHYEAGMAAGYASAVAEQDPCSYPRNFHKIGE